MRVIPHRDQSRKALPARWPLALLALPAGVATWSGWVGLGEKTGFGVVKPLPGIADVEINTAITLPIGIEVYAAFALGAWLSSRPGISTGTRRFAKWSAFAALALGCVGQVAFHLLEVAGWPTAPWWITTLVSCLPVLVLGAGAALGHLLGRDAQTTAAADEVPAERSEAAQLAEELREWTEAIRRKEDPEVHAAVTSMAAYIAGRNLPAPSASVAELAETSMRPPAPAVPEQPAAAAAPVLIRPARTRSKRRPHVFRMRPRARAERTPRQAPEVISKRTVPDELVPAALKLYGPDHTEDTAPSLRKIRADLRVGAERAKRIRAFLIGQSAA